jgi:hypothetical protein
MVTFLAKKCQPILFFCQGKRIKEKIAAPNEVISLGEHDLGQIAAPDEVISLGDSDSGQIAAPDEVIPLGEANTVEIAAPDDVIPLGDPDSGQIVTLTKSKCISPVILALTSSSAPLSGCSFKM